LSPVYVPQDEPQKIGVTAAPLAMT